MRKSLSVMLAGALVLAGVVAVFALWLPARHASQDRKWQAAGERALARVTLAPAFHTYDPSRLRLQVCGGGPREGCFVASGDPQDNVAAARAALSSVAIGPVDATCQKTSLPNSPESCSLLVPVAGSKLAVNLFARVPDPTGPISTWKYNGTYANVHLTSR